MTVLAASQLFMKKGSHHFYFYTVIFALIHHLWEHGQWMTCILKFFIIFQWKRTPATFNIVIFSNIGVKHMLIYLEKEIMTFDLTCWNSYHVTILQVFLGTFNFKIRRLFYVIVYSQYLSPLTAVVRFTQSGDKCSIQVSTISL